MIEDATAPTDPWDLAERMLKAGRARWTDIARATGFSAEKVRRRLDPEYRRRRNQRANESRVRILAEITPAARIVGTARVSPKDAERAIAAIPPDTRNLTARAFGDPLPGRSALDQRKASS